MKMHHCNLCGGPLGAIKSQVGLRIKCPECLRSCTPLLRTSIECEGQPYTEEPLTFAPIDIDCAHDVVDVLSSWDVRQVFDALSDPLKVAVQRLGEHLPVDTATRYELREAFASVRS